MEDLSLNLERRGIVSIVGDTRTLADYPHVVENILSLIGTPEFAEYYTGLVQSDSARSGFPFRVLLELSGIFDLHTQIFEDNKSKLSESQLLNLKELGLDDIWVKNFQY